MKPAIQAKLQAITTEFTEEVLGIIRQSLLLRVESYKNALRETKPSPKKPKKQRLSPGGELDPVLSLPDSAFAILTRDSFREGFLMTLPDGRTWRGTRARDLRRQARLKGIPVEDRT